jgi:hypothetical protein
MGVTIGCVREPVSLTLPILVGFVGFFDFIEKKQQTPLQSRGTRLRAVFAVRKQHTKQVTPVEAVSLIVHPNVV